MSMRLHVVLPDKSASTGPARITALARQAEQLGYDGLWLGDDGLPPDADCDMACEPLTILAYLAGVTTRIRLGASALPLALRDPFAVAKQVATLDRFSAGRFTLGVGLGWDREEFKHAGVDGSGRTGEAMRLLRQLFEQGSGPSAGERFGLDAGVSRPRPGGGPQIIVRGASPPALRRAACSARVQQRPPFDCEQLTALVTGLHRQAGQPIKTGARISWEDPGVPVDRVVAELHAWDAAGADHLAVRFGSLDGFEQRMNVLAVAGDPSWLHDQARRMTGAR
jgi:alkanesulfonate monooxygenase SsuD/methylene tetrahydromethanopterin reductase-like flavin-dependent oxidoreductase (luciferase family)